MILPGLLLTLDEYSSWRVGRVVPMIRHPPVTSHPSFGQITHVFRARHASPKRLRTQLEFLKRNKLYILDGLRVSKFSANFILIFLLTMHENSFVYFTGSAEHPTLPSALARFTRHWSTGSKFNKQMCPLTIWHVKYI